MEPRCRKCILFVPSSVSFGHRIALLTTMKRSIPDPDDSTKRPKTKKDLPLHVVLRKKEDEDDKATVAAAAAAVAADGSNAHPFRSLEDAESAMNDLARRSFDEDEIHVKVDCDCDEQEVCGQASCRTVLCRKHGTGKGSYDKEGRYFKFDIETCCDCDEISCERHSSENYNTWCPSDENFSKFVPVLSQEEKWFSSCQVCEGISYAYDGYGPNRVMCKGCMNVCKKTITLEGNEDEEKVGQVCGFRCCSEHYQDHKCGDDPQEYM